jgi:hypothetical protein
MEESERVRLTSYSLTREAAADSADLTASSRAARSLADSFSSATYNRR